MSHIEGPDIIGGYDLDTAHRLLGVAAPQSTEDHSLINSIYRLVCSIWIIIQRTFTYVVGDCNGNHLWYNNEAAVRIIERFCEPRDFRIGTNTKVIALYRSLCLRDPSSNCCTNTSTSYADILRSSTAFRFPNGVE